MRFGIMTMQMNALIPPGIAPQGLMAHLAGFDHAALARSLVGAGFSVLELSGDLSLFFPDSFGPASVERLAALKAETGVGYTVHLPLWSVEPSTPLEPVRAGSVEAVAQVARAALPLEPEAYVLHATGSLAAEFYTMHLPDAAKAYLMRQFQAQARRSVEALLSETGLPSRALAIETVGFPFELTLELAETLDLSMCLDTGHVLAGFSGPVGLLEALDRCLPRLAEIHLHDAPWQGPERKVVYGKDHQALGEGDLDVARFIDRLVEAGYDGPIILEVTVAEAQRSLDVIRAVRPEALP